MSDEERFWSQVKKSDGCWEWTGRLTGDGYGAFAVNGIPVRAHRWSYQAVVGPIPLGMFVCHDCDNRPCVRPKHLWLGTSADNNADMVSKGRNRFPTGTAVVTAKLTPDDVLEMRRLYPVVPTRELAQRFRVSIQQAWAVVSGRSWKRLPGATVKVSRRKDQEGRRCYATTAR